MTRPKHNARRLSIRFADLCSIAQSPFKRQTMKVYQQKALRNTRISGQIALAVMLLMICALASKAQTNTFPSTGNAGVGTTSPTIGTGNTGLQISGASGPGSLRLTSTATGGQSYELRPQRTG